MWGVVALDLAGELCSKDRSVRSSKHKRPLGRLKWIAVEA